MIITWIGAGLVLGFTVIGVVACCVRCRARKAKKITDDSEVGLVEQAQPEEESAVPQGEFMYTPLQFQTPDGFPAFVPMQMPMQMQGDQQVPLYPMMYMPAMFPQQISAPATTEADQKEDTK
jgi:hypothetical protein